MKLLEKIENKRVYLLVITIISAVAFLLRIIGCFWGFPYCLHPDEAVIVEPAMDMISRHSWQAFSYFRPDQVEIKLDAIMFTAFSWVRYHKPAYEAFNDHRIFFVVVARCLTAFFGTAMVPLGASFVGCLLVDADRIIKRISQISVAFILAFSAIFVEHSSYATPDIGLSFFILLFSWFVLRYLEKGDNLSLIACAVSIGLGVTTKYSAAVLSIPIAIAVIYRTVRIEKKPIRILKNGVIVVLVSALTVFVVAPNLFTDILTVYEHVIGEAGEKNAGAYGLGFGGNLFFYLKTFCKDIGVVSVAFAISGLIYMIKNRSSRWLALITGLVYWVCISAIDLHWVRWGLPHFVFYAVVVSIGVGNALRVVQFNAASERYGKICRVAGYFILTVFAVNLILAGLCQAKCTRTPDTRITAMQFLSEHHIDKENSIYTAYTPYALWDGLGENDLFDSYEDYVNVIPFFANREYYVTNASWKERYLTEKNRLRDSIILCENIENRYNLIHEEVADGNYNTSPSVLANIYQSARYLLSHHNSTGSAVLVYDLAPRALALRNMETGTYLGYLQDRNGNLAIGYSEEPSPWILYDDVDGSFALINADYTDEEYLQRGLIAGETGLLLKADDLDLVTAEGMHMLKDQWTIKEENDCYIFVNSSGMVLSVDDTSVRLEKPVKDDKCQKWQAIAVEEE